MPSKSNKESFVIAIRAPYGSTLEIPCEAQIKEKHALAMGKSSEKEA
jgi:hypothetical protein